MKITILDAHLLNYIMHYILGDLVSSLYTEQMFFDELFFTNLAQEAFKCIVEYPNYFSTTEIRHVYQELFVHLGRPYVITGSWEEGINEAQLLTEKWYLLCYMKKITKITATNQK